MQFATRSRAPSVQQNMLRRSGTSSRLDRLLCARLLLPTLCPYTPPKPSCAERSALASNLVCNQAPSMTHSSGHGPLMTCSSKASSCSRYLIYDWSRAQNSASVSVLRQAVEHSPLALPISPAGYGSTFQAPRLRTPLDHACMLKVKCLSAAPTRRESFRTAP